VISARVTSLTTAAHNPLFQLAKILSTTDNNTELKQSMTEQQEMHSSLLK